MRGLSKNVAIVINWPTWIFKSYCVTFSSVEFVFGYERTFSRLVSQINFGTFFPVVITIPKDCWPCCRPGTCGINDAIYVSVVYSKQPNVSWPDHSRDMQVLSKANKCKIEPLYYAVKLFPLKFSYFFHSSIYKCMFH